MNVFREPTGELPKPFYLSSGRVMLCIDEPTDMLTHEAEALLEVLLDICPNAEALAHNWLLERQKAEYMKRADGPNPPFDNHGHPCEPSGETGELP